MTDSSLAVTRSAVPFGRRTAAALVVLHLILCAILFDPKIHTGGDSATYVLLAESVLEQGDGYALSIEPGPPAAHTHYPPGYPVLLAPAVALFGRNFVALKLLSVLFTAATVLVFCLYIRRRHESVPWFCLALPFAVSPGLIDYSRWMLSEAPFVLFTLLALWQLREDGEHERIGWPFVLGLLASIACFYVRSIGALLLVGASLSYLTRREWRRFLIYGAVGSGLTIPWLVRNQFAAGSASPYFEQFRQVSVYMPEAGYLDLAGFADRFLTNVWLYASREMPRALVGSDSPWAAHALVAAASLILCGLALVGLVRAFRRPAAAEFYFVLYCLAVLLFQESVNDVRYLLPILPLILIYGMDAAASIARRVGRLTRPAVAPIAVAAVLTTVAMVSAAARAPANMDMLRRYSAGDRYAGYHPAWRNFFEATAWVRDSTPADAIVTVRKPRLFSALSDRRVRQYPYSDPDSVLRVVRSTDYVVVDPIHGTTARYLLPAIQRESDSFVVTHQTREPVTWVLGVRDPVEP